MTTDKLWQAMAYSLGVQRDLVKCPAMTDTAFCCIGRNYYGSDN